MAVAVGIVGLAAAGAVLVLGSTWAGRVDSGLGPGAEQAVVAATVADGSTGLAGGPRPSQGTEATDGTGRASPAAESEITAPGAPSSASPSSMGSTSTGSSNGATSGSTASTGPASGSPTTASGSGTDQTVLVVPSTTGSREPSVSTATTGRRSTTTTMTSTTDPVRPSTGVSTTATPTTRSTSSSRSSSSTTTKPTTITSPPTTARPTTTTTTTTPGPTSGSVVWQDDFDRLDPSVWRLEHSTYGDGNNELQCYRPGNVAVRGGSLVLTARSETVTCPNGSTRQVSSGMIRSRGVTFSPGQAIEFRVKLTPADPNDQGGLWPAVWSSSWAGGWPVGGELDFLEVMTAEDPTRAMFSMHHAGPDGRHRLQNQGVWGSENFSARWHTVRFDYGRNGRLRWYLDGVPAFAVDAADTLQGYPAPFDQSIGEIKINLALGGRPGPLAPGALGSTGATFQVDYIRIIQL